MSGAPFDPVHYSAEVILRDGRPILVRAIRPDDQDRLLRHFKELSEDSRYHRFFGVKRSLSEDELIQFTTLDFTNHVGLVATLEHDGEERFVGDARYIRTEPTRAEVAVAVVDEYQGRGIATILLEHLGRIARAAGISEFEADVLGDNNRMLEVFAKSGFRVRRAAAAGVIHLAFPTAETEESAAASEARERKAAARSVERILRPKSVAVIGASREKTKLGGRIFANLREGGFTGAIYPVNFEANEVQGVRSFRSLEAIGQPIDLAVIAVPAAAVEEQITRCARAGVHAVVVISAGFGETGEPGRRAENRIRDLARHSGMRLVGPNCMGVVNTDPGVRLNATFSPVRPPAGNIGIFSQSGALGTIVFEHLSERDLGISTFVAAGNRADVSNNDLIAFWADDPATGLIALYLESVGNPRNFAKTARDVALIKPIVAVKSGRSAAGRRVASSHSAAVANRDVAVDAFFAQAGVIRADTLEALFDIAAILSTQPLPKGPRVGVVSNAGGAAVLFADACDAQGLKLAALQTATIEKLNERLKLNSVITNPVDLTASGSLDHLEYAIGVVGNDQNVDSLVVIHAPPIADGSSQAAAAITRGAVEIRPTKPVVAVFQSIGSLAAKAGSESIPTYAFPENPAMALGAAWRYAQWCNGPRGSVHTLSRFAHETVRAVVDRAASESGGGGMLSPEDVATILRAAAITISQPEDSTGSRDRPSNHRQPPSGILMFAEVTIDSTFGPLIACGFGGAIAELVGDITFRLYPLTDLDAAEMINSLKANKLLEGYPDQPPADRKALTDLLVRVSALIETIPEMTELELNPIYIQPAGKGAIVHHARIQIESPRPPES